MRTGFGPPAQWSRLCLTEFSKQKARNIGVRLSGSRCTSIAWMLLATERIPLLFFNRSSSRRAKLSFVWTLIVPHLSLISVNSEMRPKLEMWCTNYIYQANLSRNSEMRSKCSLGVTDESEADHLSLSWPSLTALVKPGKLVYPRLTAIWSVS